MVFLEFQSVDAADFARRYLPGLIVKTDPKLTSIATFSFEDFKYLPAGSETYARLDEQNYPPCVWPFVAILAALLAHIACLACILQSRCREVAH